MLLYSWSGQRWSNLLHWPASCYALLTFADNTALPGFLYFYTCSLNVSLHRVIISINFSLIYVIWWALTHSARSYLWMNGWERRAFSFTTHTLKRAWRLNEDINTRATSPELLWESLLPFHLSKTILISYTHRNVKVFTATRQNNSPGVLKTLQQKYLFSEMYILLKLWKLCLRIDHTTFLTCFNFNNKFPLFAKKV